MLRRSLENVDSVVIDDVELEVRQELNRRRLACEEALDNFEALYHQVEEIRLEKAEKVQVIAARIDLALEAAIERAREAADDAGRD
ncbi:hypothetical protein MMC27_002103 [Xylographa pallens]|nr:hypothetical protein [Xylographa pallens]